MKYSFAFRSRNSAFRFLDAVRSEGISARIVNAPRSGGSCALGVEVDERDLVKARRIMNPHAFNSFIGIFGQ